MILIDCREPDKIIKNLESFLEARVLALKYGDYSFSDTIIERKTLSDFFSSLKNDRLMEQMENLARFYTEKYILIEGFFDFSHVNNIEYLYSSLIAVTLNFDVKIIFSKDDTQTAATIKRLYHQRNFCNPLHVQKKAKIYHATKFFEVSRKKLEIIYSTFGTIRNFLMADKKELRGIKLVGKNTIEKLRNTLESNIFE